MHRMKERCNDSRRKDWHSVAVRKQGMRSKEEKVLGEEEAVKEKNKKKTVKDEEKEKSWMDPKGENESSENRHPRRRTNFQVIHYLYLKKQEKCSDSRYSFGTKHMSISSFSRFRGILYQFPLFFFRLWYHLPRCFVLLFLSNTSSPGNITSKSLPLYFPSQWYTLTRDISRNLTREPLLWLTSTSLEKWPFCPFFVACVFLLR